MSKNIIFFTIFLTTSYNLISQNHVLPFIVGASQQIITPTDTAYIAGHSHNRKFSGVHDDIYVKAIVISNTTDTIAILTFDCIGLLYPQLLEIRKRVKTALPFFPIENIVMTSTHTHSGPDVVGIWGKGIMHSGVDPTYMDTLVARASHTIIDGWLERKRCKAVYGQSAYGYDWVYNISESEELDRSVTVLKFLDDHSSNIATLTNFACHPTFLDAANDKVSSDYVGGYYKKLDEEQGGVNLFLQGSIGGWVQPEHEEKTASRAFFRGAELGSIVLSILEKPIPLKGDKIELQSRQFKMPVENPGFVQLSQLGILNRDFTDSVLTEVAYFNIGNASFATHPGETVPALSKRTKELMQNDGPKFILGLGMDALGYILKPYFFNADKSIPHSKYLCSVSVGPQTQAYVYKILVELINPKKVYSK